MVLVAGAAAFALATLMVVLLRNSMAWLSARRRFLEPGRYTPEQWRALMERARWRTQNGLLLRTSQQTVGLDAEAFLQLLRGVEKNIRDGPAVDTYWSLRHDLERVVRQQQQGG